MELSSGGNLLETLSSASTIFQVRGICCDLLGYLFYSNVWKQDLAPLHTRNECQMTLTVDVTLKIWQVIYVCVWRRSGTRFVIQRVEMNVVWHRMRCRMVRRQLYDEVRLWTEWRHLWRGDRTLPLPARKNWRQLRHTCVTCNDFSNETITVRCLLMPWLQLWFDFDSTTVRRPFDQGHQRHFDATHWCPLTRRPQSGWPIYLFRPQCLYLNECRRIGVEWRSNCSRYRTRNHRLSSFNCLSFVVDKKQKCYTINCETLAVTLLCPAPNRRGH